MADGGAEPLRLRAMLYPETRTPNNALLSFPPAAPQQTMLSHLPDLLCVSLAVMMVERSTLQSRSLPGETDPGNSSIINAVSPLHRALKSPPMHRDVIEIFEGQSSIKRHASWIFGCEGSFLCFIAGELWPTHGCFLVQLKGYLVQIQSQWGPATEWFPTFFKLSSFFTRGCLCILVDVHCKIWKKKKNLTLYTAWSCIVCLTFKFVYTQIWNHILCWYSN